MDSELQCAKPEQQLCSKSEVFPVVGNEKYGGFMRKLFVVMIAGFIACLASAPAATAGPISLTLSSASSTTTLFTISGTYASNVPTFSFNGVNVSAPNDSYSLTFTLNTAAATNTGFSVPADGLFNVLANVSISLNGGTTMSFGVPFLVEFADTSNIGGLALCFDSTGAACANPPVGPNPLATGWEIAGQQLFSGTTNNPSSLNFITTTGAQIDQGNSGFFIDNGPTFTGPASTPEPSSIFLLGTGLLGLGFAVRRKLRL